MKIYKYDGKCNIIGPRVRQVRERLKISQEMLAARLQLEGIDLTQRAISRIETQDRVVADYELRALAKALNVSVLWLLLMTDDSTPESRKQV